jgi:hypothetical protein
MEPLQKYELRTAPRLLGGWDVGPEEFTSLGFTLGLPPLLEIDPSPDTIAYSLQLRDYFEDGLTGAHTEMTDVLYQATRAQLYIRDIDDRYQDPDEIREQLDAVFSRVVPAYEPGALIRIRLDTIGPNHERAAVATFLDPFFAQTILRQRGRIQFGHNPLFITLYTAFEGRLPPFGTLIRASRRNFAVRPGDPRRMAEIRAAFPGILEHRFVDESRAVCLTATPLDAEKIVAALRPDYEAAILAIPAPPRRPEYVVLARDMVTVLRRPNMSFADVLTENDIAEPREVEGLGEGHFNSLRIYNVFTMPILKNQSVWAKIKDDLRKRVVKYGYVGSIEPPDPPVLYGLHTYVTIKFSVKNAAAAAQASLAGQYLLGRPIVCQLCNT